MVWYTKGSGKAIKEMDMDNIFGNNAILNDYK
jgi:hypothetical protein